MEILYSILMSGVFLAILASLYEAIRAVTRKPAWQTVVAARQETPQPAAVPAARILQVIQTEDRRTHHLPFVGSERREAEQAEQLEEALAKSS
jgi:hypothetical protein